MSTAVGTVVLSDDLFTAGVDAKRNGGNSVGNRSINHNEGTVSAPQKPMNNRLGVRVAAYDLTVRIDPKGVGAARNTEGDVNRSEPALRAPQKAMTVPASVGVVPYNLAFWVDPHGNR